MAVIIEMPKLSDTMKTGTLVKWLKKEGDAIKPGDLLAEVETDKATMEIENFEEGILLKQYVKEGQAVPIGAQIAAVGKKGEVVREMASKEVPNASVKNVVEPVILETKKVGLEKTNSLEGGRLRASPLARKIAADEGIALESIMGTGPMGRIIKKDVLAMAQIGEAALAVKPLKAKADTVKPVTDLRATIARRLVESKTQLPHFYLDMEINAAPLMELRESLNKHLESMASDSKHKLTVNDFILKGVAVAIQRIPSINASWAGEKIIEHGNIHLAFGVAIEEGLVTPVIRNAQSKTLQQISSEAKVLIEKARAKKLKPDEMTGSTFTVTNLGMYGIDQFYGIINPPNAAILSVGALVKKPVVDNEGRVVPGQRMHIGLSGDHRVIDGAIAAQFLSALRSVLETPAILLLNE